MRMVPLLLVPRRMALGPLQELVQFLQHLL